MLISGLIAGMIIFSLFLAMLTQSPRKVEDEPVPVPARRR